jgi:hypothetical protein
MLYAASFLDDVALLPVEAEEGVWTVLELVESVPGCGSALLAPSLVRRFGLNCLKVAAAGFDILYRRVDERDEIQVLGIVHQKAVR